MTDEKLALLEHLTYIDKHVLYAAGIPRELLTVSEKSNVGQVLEVFSPERIEKLREFGDDMIQGALITGNEWADIIETIKSDPELSKLKVYDYTEYESSKNSKVNLQIAYEVPDTKECIITYKGTSGRVEWEDNVRGLFLDKTPCQKQALEFFDMQAKNHEKLTVVGHSKGANKAMFVTIASEYADKIKKCVAIDGQGFSNQFLDKYTNEIKERGDKITNYFVSSDFVNILMKHVSNSHQVPCKGFEMSSPLQAHSPDSILERDTDGRLLLSNSNPSFFKVNDRDESMKVIQGFVSYTMDNRSPDKLEKIGNYLAPIVGTTLGGEKEQSGVIGRVKKVLAIAGLMLQDPKTAFDVFKVLHEYNRDCGITSEQKRSVLEAFNIIKKKEQPEVDLVRVPDDIEKDDISEVKKFVNADELSKAPNLCELGKFLESEGKTGEIKKLGKYMAHGGEMTVVSVEERVSRDLCEKLREEHISYLIGDNNGAEISLYIPAENTEKLNSLESDLLKEMGSKHAIREQPKELSTNIMQQKEVEKNRDEERCI